MATRLTVTLEPKQRWRATQKAAGEGVSLAEYIRRLVAQDLGDERPSIDVSSLFALFDTGGSDVAAHKDTYVSQAWRPHNPGAARLGECVRRHVCLVRGGGRRCRPMSR